MVALAYSVDKSIFHVNNYKKALLHLCSYLTFLVLNFYFWPSLFQPQCICFSDKLAFVNVAFALCSLMYPFANIAQQKLMLLWRPQRAIFRQFCIIGKTCPIAAIVR